MKRNPIQKMTLDKLEQMTQREFFLIGERFDKVDRRFDKVDEDSHLLRRDMESGFSAFSESMKTIIEKLNDIQKYVIGIYDLHVRVERLEKKVGLR